MNVSFRMAEPSDLDLLMELDAQAAGERAWPESAWRAVLTTSDATVLLALKDVALGFLAVRWIVDEGHVQTLGVVAEARRQGVAGALLDEGERLGRIRGVCAWLLEVRSDNLGAIMLYENVGYAEVGRRPRYYACGADAVLMTRKV